MKRAHASSSVAVATLAIALVAAGWGTGILAAHPEHEQAAASGERVRLDVVVTETGGSAETAGEAAGSRAWRVRAMTTIGNLVRIASEAMHVGATALLAGDGRVAVSLEVRAFRTRWSGPGRMAIDATVSVALEDGERTIVAEAANPANGSVVTVEVTATVLDGTRQPA